MSASYCNAYDYERIYGCLPPTDEPKAEVVTPEPEVQTKVVTAPPQSTAPASGPEVQTG